MAKVKLVETTAELQSLLDKSNLLEGEKLAAASQMCAASDSPKNAARQMVKEGLLTVWQANQLLGGFYALTMGNYRMLDQIGKGELGRVYLAQHAKMGNKVALKALASKSASDPKLVERFLEEARTAGAFEHRNVLRVLDVASERERPFVVTEFVAGGDLQQRVEKGGPLTPTDAAGVLLQTSEGMAYVHSKNVLHRDLKPANLLLDDKGVVKILDVGVGQLRQSDKTGSENTGELLLSALGYMSPEQVRNKELDARSDIYALGGTFYFLLTGRVPYTAASNEERDVIRQTKRPVPVATLKPDTPTELANLCDQMMALKPSDRPASMDEVAQRVRNFLQGDSPQPAPAAETAVEVTPEVAEAADVPVFVDATEPKVLSDTVHQVGSDTVPFQGALESDLSELVIETEKEPPSEPVASEPVAKDASAVQESSEKRPEQTTIQENTVQEQLAQKGLPIETPEDEKPKLEISAPVTIEPGFFGNSVAVEGESVKIKVEGAPVAESVAVAPGAFKIQKKKKAEIAEAISSTAEPDSPLALAAKKAKRQRLILIATAAGSCLIILISIGIYKLSSGDDTQLAKSDIPPDSPAAPAAAASTAGGQPVAGGLSPNDPENIPDPEDIPDPQATAAPSAQAAANPGGFAGIGAAGQPGAAAVGAGVTASGGSPASAPGASPAAAGAASAPPPAVAATAPAPAADPTAPTTTTVTTAAPPTPATAATGQNPMPAVVAAAPTSPATTETPTAGTPAPAAAPTTAAVTAPASASATPAATPAPMPPPAAAAPATADTRKADTPKTEAPKPEAPKTEPPKTPAKSAKTFEIAAAVDLPRLPSSDGSTPAEAPAKVLGKVNIDPKDTCFLAMYGGDKAMKGRMQFSLRNAQNGTAPRDWEVVQEDGSNSSVVIATLSLPAQELKFEWTPDGLKSPAASALRNCAIKITAGQEKPYFVAFRTVQLTPPMMTANIEKSTLTAKFPLEAVPDSSALRLEPVAPGQKIVFDAGGPDITKGDQWIFFGENKEQAPLALKLDTSTTAKGIQISAASYVLLPNEKPQKLTPALRKKLSLPDMQRQSTAIAAELAKKRSKEEQDKMQTQLNQAGVLQRNLDQLIQRVQKLDELIQQLNNNGKIHFRIFYDAGETQVDLVKTDDSAPTVK